MKVTGSVVETREVAVLPVTMQTADWSPHEDKSCRCCGSTGAQMLMKKRFSSGVIV